MLRGPQLLLIRQQSKDKGSVPLLLTPIVSRSAEEPEMDPSPAESRPLCAMSGLPLFLPMLWGPLGGGRPLPLSCHHTCPGRRL